MRVVQYLVPLLELTNLDGELQQTLARDQRRFEKADTNGDGKLTKEEFAAFLHPEEFDHMRDIVIGVSQCIIIGCEQNVQFL